MRIPRPIAGIASALALLCGVTASVGAPSATAASSLPTPDHIVIVMMENEPYSSIIGNTSQAPYINSLAQQGVSFSDAHGEWHPSLPNYYAMLSGSTQGLVNSTPPPPGSVNADNLPNELAQHGLSFADYNNNYNPAAWLRFADLPGTSTSPNPVDKWLTCPPPAPGQGCGFPTDATGYAGLPTVSFVAGSQNQDMHDGNILAGDTWVKNTFGGYAEWAKTHNSLLIVTWDEDNPSNPQTINHIPTVFYGANLHAGSYSETINHYNILRTIEDMYGLPYLANEATATPITDIWGHSTFGTGSGPGPITGYLSHCVDDSGSGTADGNPIILYSCTGSANQTWTLPGDGTIRDYGKCMDVVGGGTANSTKVDLNTCNGSGAQQWVAQANGTLLNPQSGKCLDDPGSQPSGYQLIIYTCSASANQLWRLPA